MKRIKNSAVVFLAAAAIVVGSLVPATIIQVINADTPAVANAQSGELRAHCNAGLYTGGLATITQVKLQNDDDHYEIVVANDYASYLLEYATTKVARTAGSMIGERVEFHGTVSAAHSFVGSDNPCDIVELTNWDFAKN